jgi:hypothetical protein
LPEHRSDRDLPAKTSWRYCELGIDLTRSEAASGERSTSGRFRAGRQPWAAAAVPPGLQRKMPPEGLAWTPHRDAVWRSDCAASSVSMHHQQSHRDERRLAIAMPIDARAGPTAGSSFRLDDLSRRRWRVPISCSRSAARSTMERSAWVRTSLSTTRQPERAVGQPGIIPHSLDTPYA